jgi:uncharacterized protein (TIRG00374 family)
MSPRCEVDAAADPRSTRRRPLYWLISIPLAAILLYFALRGVDWGRVGHIAATARIPLIVLAAAVMTVNSFVRAVRWCLLLNGGPGLSLATVFWSNSAGYMANGFLPARTGELLRSAMISARSGLSKTYVLTTALTERMMDAVALIAISSVLLLTIDRKPEWLASASKPFAIIGLGGVLAVIVLPRSKALIESILARIPLPVKLRDRLVQMTEQVLLGFRTLHHGGRLAGFSSLTATIWFLDASSNVIMARALGINLGLPLALLMLTAIGLSSALPSTPGNVGVAQFVTVSVLVPFGIAHTDAFAFALIGQALTYVVVASLGFIGLWRYNSVRAS